MKLWNETNNWIEVQNDYKLLLNLEEQKKKNKSLKQNIIQFHEHNSNFLVLSTKHLFECECRRFGYKPNAKTFRYWLNELLLGGILIVECRCRLMSMQHSFVEVCHKFVSLSKCWNLKFSFHFVHFNAIYAIVISRFEKCCF